MGNSSRLHAMLRRRGSVTTEEAIHTGVFTPSRDVRLLRQKGALINTIREQTEAQVQAKGSFRFQTRYTLAADVAAERQDGIKLR